MNAGFLMRVLVRVHLLRPGPAVVYQGVLRATYEWEGLRHAKLIGWLNRLSAGCGTMPRRESGYLQLLFVYKRDLYNAATSRTLVNHAVISIFINNCKLYLYLCCVNISLILNSFCNTALFDKKSYPYLILILVNPAVIRIF